MSKASNSMEVKLHNNVVIDILQLKAYSLFLNRTLTVNTTLSITKDISQS